MALATAQSGMHQYADAHASVDEALRITRTRLGAEHPKVADGLDVKATVFQDQERFAESLSTYQASLELKRKLFGPKDASLFYSYDGIGQSLLGLGRAREAVSALQTALSIQGPAAGDRADTQFGLARALWTLGTDRSAALRYGQEAKSGYAAAKRPARTQAVERWLAARR